MVLPHEPEFEQALNELTQSLGPFLKKNPEYQKALDKLASKTALKVVVKPV